MKNKYIKHTHISERKFREVLKLFCAGIEAKIVADCSYKRHDRVIYSDNEFANGSNHINNIENFWGLCKVRLAKFRWIHKTHFLLHLKECEFRYNNRDKDIYKFLLKNFRNSSLK